MRRLPRKSGVVDKEPEYDSLTMVRMAIIERDDRLFVLMPSEASKVEIEEFIETYRNHGWPVDRIMVTSGPEAFAVVKPSKDQEA